MSALSITYFVDWCSFVAFTRPPGVASASTCFPDADPTMTPRDRLLHSQVRAGAPNKMPRMSAMPPDKRFAYWDCARALPRAQGRSPRSWLGSTVKCPQRDQREPEPPFRSRSANPLASSPPWTTRHRFEWRLHFWLGLLKVMFLRDKDWVGVVKTIHFPPSLFLLWGTSEREV